MLLRRFLLFLFAGCVLGVPALVAQSGQITASQCVPIDTTGKAVIGIQVAGTFTGTLQPQVSVQGQAPTNISVAPIGSSTPQTTITATGTFTASVAGMNLFQVCGNTVSSGTALVYLNPNAANGGTLIGEAVDAGGRQIVVGPTAPGTADAATTNPVQLAGIDSTSLVHKILTNTVGYLSLGSAHSATDAGANNLGLNTTDNAGNSLQMEIRAFTFNGATWDRTYKCNQTAIINVSTATTTSLVAVSGSTKVHVCAWYITGGGTLAVSTAAFEFGTGAACVTTQALITGAMVAATATVGNSIGQSGLTWESAASSALCLVSTGTATQTGYVSFAQY